MAITQLSLTFELGLEEVFQVAKRAGLHKGSRLEVVESWDMLQIWQDWVSEQFGEFVSIHHLSKGDDPPDFRLTFREKIVGFEHTRLQPEHLGRANALLEKAPEGGGMPSVSCPPKTFDEMMDIIVGVKASWVPVSDEWKAISALLASGLRWKMLGQPGGGIIGMVHDLVHGNAQNRILAKMAHEIINSTEFSDFGPYTLILLNRPNIISFNSALLQRSTELRERSE